MILFHSSNNEHTVDAIQATRVTLSIATTAVKLFSQTSMRTLFFSVFATSATQTGEELAQFSDSTPSSVFSFPEITTIIPFSVISGTIRGTKELTFALVALKEESDLIFLALLL